MQPEQMQQNNQQAAEVQSSISLQPELGKPISKNKKVSLNPFRHLWRGTKNLFTINPVGAILLTAISYIIPSILITILFIWASMTFLLSFSLESSFLVAGLLFVVICAASLYLNQLVVRAVLKASRNEKASFLSLFPFVARRYLSALAVAIIFVLVYVLCFVLLSLVAIINPFITLLVGLVLIVAVTIIFLRFSYSFFIVVDDEKPGSLARVFDRSKALWFKSGGALIIYFLTLLAFYAISYVSIFIFQAGSAFNQANPQVENYDYSYSSNYDSSQIGTLPIDEPSNSFFVGGALIYLIISILSYSIIQLIIMAGLGNIYNEAKKITDGGSTNTDDHFSKAPMPIQPASNSPAPITPMGADVIPEANSLQPKTAQISTPIETQPVREAQQTQNTDQDSSGIIVG